MIAGAGMLTACASSIASLNDQPLGVTPTEQYPLETVPAPEEVYLTAHDWGLSEAQAEALRTVAANWRSRGNGGLRIEAPNSREASATAYAARDALTSFGVPQEAIAVTGASAPPTAPVRVSFMGVQGRIHDCSRQWPDLSKTMTNQPTSNFGCAVNANLAAMIANPADIDGPRAQEPADAGRRQVVIDKYRRGENTSATRNEDADGTVSTAVN
jgi:pilus assembly protein CpaD